MIPGPNWTRRYGTPTRRLCARAGCGAVAAATLRFQPTRREAWLVEIDDDAARTEGDLCVRHASDLVLPRGWALHDQRPRAAGLEHAVEVDPPEVDPPEVDPVPVAVEVEFDLDEPSAIASTRAPRVRHTPRSRRPRSVPAPAIGPAEETEELANLLDAQTPLLRRAFGNVHLED